MKKKSYYVCIDKELNDVLFFDSKRRILFLSNKGTFFESAARAKSAIRHTMDADTLHEQKHTNIVVKRIQGEYYYE